MHGGLNRHIFPIHTARLVMRVEQGLPGKYIEFRPFAADNLKIGDLPFRADGKYRIARTRSVDWIGRVPPVLAVKLGDHRRSGLRAERINAICSRFSRCQARRRAERVVNLLLWNFPPIQVEGDFDGNSHRNRCAILSRCRLKRYCSTAFKLFFSKIGSEQRTSLISRGIPFTSTFRDTTQRPLICLCCAGFG